jgi:hypothetical protein
MPGITEREDLAFSGNQPVAAAFGRGDYGSHPRGELEGVLRAEKFGIAVAVNLPEGVGQPITLTVLGRGDTDNRRGRQCRLEPPFDLTVTLRVPEREDVPLLGDDPVPLAIGRWGDPGGIVAGNERAR